MMDKGYKDILLIEPVSNRLLRSLARSNIAQRVEYSGVAPSRLDLRQVEELCRQKGYSAVIKTNWKIPNDYYWKITGGRQWVGSLVVNTVRVLSRLTSVAKLGNSAVIHLTKQQ